MLNDKYKGWIWDGFFWQKWWFPGLIEMKNIDYECENICRDLCSGTWARWQWTNLLCGALNRQAVCEWGRESVESWGRRKRSIGNQTAEKSEEDMTLSQEILVLDFGDDKTSTSLKSEASSSEFGKGERCKRQNHSWNQLLIKLETSNRKLPTTRRNNAMA